MQTLWLRPTEAAGYLGVDLKTLWAYEAAGLLKAVAPHGRGVGKRVYFHRDDVEAFARTGLAQKARKPTEGPK